ncbi:MAG: NAD-dependent epimerase/dehydratase family protein [Gemmatimonadota bacterium]
MRVFITGASGYVGSAIAGAFVEAGHDVTGLYHSSGSEGGVRDLGAEAVQGDIGDPDTFQAAARDHDVYVHAAFDAKDPARADRDTVEALLRMTGDAEARSPRMILYTSGCWVLGDTGEEPADEEAPTDHPAEIVAWRPRHEEQVLTAATEVVATAVIRPGMVYGGSGGLVSRLFETAVEDDAAAYVGKGGNRWSLIHRGDLARLYLRVAEERAGGIFHGVDGQPLQVTELARAASVAAGAGETRGVPLDEARGELGPMADALILDQALIARRSGEIGWRPIRRDFRGAAHEAFIEWKRER